MDFYIYGFIILFTIICSIIGYLIFSKPKVINLTIGDKTLKGGFSKVPGMKSNLSKKHKKRIY